MRAQPGRFRPILTTVVVVVLLLVGWLAVEAYFALTARPNVDTDYGAQLEELAASVQPDGPERWHQYEDAVFGYRDAWRRFEGLLPRDLAELGTGIAVVYDPEPRRRDAIDKDRFEDDPTLEEALALIDAAIDRHAAWIRGEGGEALERILALRNSPGRYVFPWPSEGLLLEEALFVDLGAARAAAQGLTAFGVLAIETDDWEGYAEAVDASLWLSAVLSYQPTLIRHLVAVAVRSLVLEELIRQPVMEGALPAGVLVEVVASLDRWPMVGAAHAMEGERLWVMDAIQHTHDRRGRAIVSEQERLGRGIGPDEPGVPRIVNMAAVFMPRRASVERSATRYFDRVADDLTKPAYEQWLAGSHSDAFDALSNSSLLFDAILPSFGRFAQVSRRYALTELGVRTLVAIERHRLETGSLPATLDDLVPGYLDAVPIDPLADPEGTPLRYVVLDEPDAFGRGYVLYSVGADRTDDGGVQAEDEPLDALRRGHEGTDYVINAVAMPAE